MFQGPVSVIGGGYLLYLAYQNWLDSQATSIDSNTTQNNKDKGFAIGATLSLSNPQNIFFWSSIGASLASVSASLDPTQTLIIFFIGFTTSSVVWCFICAYCIGVFARGKLKTYFSVISKACAVILLLLGCFAIQDGVKVVF